VPSTGPNRASSPKRRWQPRCLSQGLTFVALQKGPSDDQIAGWVTETTGAEVNDRRELPIGGQEITYCNVAVNPHGRARPHGPHGIQPDGLACSNVNVIQDLLNAAWT